MMTFAALTKGASVIAAIGTIGGGAYYLDDRHAPRAEVEAMKAAGRVDTILSLVDQAHREGSSGWLCRAIEAEFIQLCTDQPQHYLCTDPEARQELKRKAGCE